MICRLAIIIAIFVCIDAVPTSYGVCHAFEKDQFSSPFIMESRMRRGVGLRNIRRPLTKTTDPEDTEEGEELNKMFWAIDSLPKESAYVSIQTLPDVYVDNSDRPSRTAGQMRTDRSGIAEESKGVNARELAEESLYHQNIPVVDNVGYSALYPQYGIYNIPAFSNVQPLVYNNTQSPKEIAEYAFAVPHEVSNGKEQNLSASTESQTLKEQPSTEICSDKTTEVVLNEQPITFPVVVDTENPFTESTSSTTPTTKKPKDVTEQKPLQSKKKN